MASQRSYLTTHYQFICILSSKASCKEQKNFSPVPIYSNCQVVEVLSKHAGLWITRDKEIMYSQVCECVCNHHDAIKDCYRCLPSPGHSHQLHLSDEV